MQWYQIKEQSAGKKRLIISWYLYKIFGKGILYLIANLVAFLTFIFSKKVRTYSKKYFETVYDVTGLKPNILNQFKHINNYATSLIDKLLVYSGDYNAKNITFVDDDKKQELFKDIEDKNGVFLICNHIGNIEILQSYLIDKVDNHKFNIDVFLSNKQSQIFNEFVTSIKLDIPVKTFLIENIGLSTGIELKEDLDNGNIVFIAGDRVSENSNLRKKHIINKTFFNKTIYLPKGTFKLAKSMNVPTYFISALKIDNKYNIYLKKQYSLDETECTTSYLKFLEELIKIAPYQFFHFYDFFN